MMSGSTGERDADVARAGIAALTVEG